MQRHKFFQNLKIVELASVLAGPAVGLFFAELGASVLKIENKTTGGDVTRRWKLPNEEVDQPLSAYYHSVNWQKNSVMVDLKEPQERAQVLAWIQEADVVISNFKTGSAEKLGLDAVTLRQLNPQLIYASITAYGEGDPRPGFDVMIQAEAGWLYMNGASDGPPVKMPVALIDILAAHQLKEGILLALLNRNQTGKGTHVTVSLFDTAVGSLANQATNYLNVGHIPQRMGSQHPNIAPYGDIFHSEDGKPLIVSTGTEKQFQKLCDCLELSRLKQDARFSTNALRLANREVLVKALQMGFQKLKAGELLLRFQEKSVPVAPIRNLAEVFEIEQAKNLILKEPLENGGESKRVRTAVFQFL